MKYLPVILISVLFAGCTYSITMVHTQGEANDVVDTSQTSKSEASADLKLPLP
jgi:hypothetical protein